MYENTIKMAPQSILCNSHQGKEQKEGRCGEDGRKIEMELSNVSTREVSEAYNDLMGEFKMTAGDVVRL